MGFQIDLSVFFAFSLKNYRLHPAVLLHLNKSGVLFPNMVSYRFTVRQVFVLFMETT